MSLVFKAHFVQYSHLPKRKIVSRINYGMIVQFSLLEIEFLFLSLFRSFTCLKHCLFLYRIRYKRRGCPIYLFRTFFFFFVTLIFFFSLFKINYASRYKYGVKEFLINIKTTIFYSLVNNHLYLHVKHMYFKLIQILENLGYHYQILLVIQIFLCEELFEFYF